jgi:hypothetical protein
LFLLSTSALLWFTINIYLLVLLFFIYVWFYFDGKEYTGERRWDAFRRFSLWKRLSPIEYTIPTSTREDLKLRVQHRVYVLVPGHTYMGLVFGVGLHGGRLEFAEYLHYVVPPVFMWIPFLRDILLWSGAVTFKGNSGLESLILDLLSHGRSVCYSASMLNGDSKNPGLQSWMLSMMREKQMQLIPIVVQNELRRYAILQQNHPIQLWFHARWHYPFPSVWIYRWCREKKRPPKLSFQMAGIIECTAKYDTNEKLIEAFQRVVSDMTNPQFGDEEIKVIHHLL